MKVAWIGKTKEPAFQSLTEDYLQRISRYLPVEGVTLRSEDLLFEMCGREPLLKSTSTARSTSAKARKLSGFSKSTLVLMDSRGKLMSSEAFAKFIGDYQDRNPLPLVFAVGPSDGFSDDARSAAQFTLSLGSMTFAHELARVVLLEQIYRALTILKGHPYHCGHC